MATYEVREDEACLRVDAYLANLDETHSRSFYSKLIKEGQLSVNSKVVTKPSFVLSEGDVVEIDIPEPKPLEVEAEDIPLDILYEDDDVIIVNKPKGMVVHPADGHANGTLVNALLFHCRDSLSGINGILRPGIVHRIDMNTTGSLIVCKNDLAHNKIAEQIKVHSINRIYLGIVHGNLKEDSGTINAPIARSKTDRKKMAIVEGGKEAITHYRVLERLNGYTFCEFKLETGRTHQIRVHMASLHHPLLGDEVYGPKKCPIKGLEGQTLHAWKIGFIHPTSGEYMEFEAPIPEYFQKLLNRLK
jgi:23S rRNA pseudouridine1911/1915/1917 synthase